jgi:hypothetical protein
MILAGNFLAEINEQLADVLAKIERQRAQDHRQRNADDRSRSRPAQVRRLRRRRESCVLPSCFKRFIYRRNVRPLRVARARFRAERPS